MRQLSSLGATLLGYRIRLALAIFGVIAFTALFPGWADAGPAHLKYTIAA